MTNPLTPDDRIKALEAQLTETKEKLDAAEQERDQAWRHLTSQNKVLVAEIEAANARAELAQEAIDSAAHVLSEASASLARSEPIPLPQP